MRTLTVLVALLALPLLAAEPARDVLPTAGGDLTISFIGHGTLAFSYAGTVVHVDPWTRLTDYAAQPKANVVLITHHHRDHLDRDALDAVRTEKTTVIASALAAAEVPGAIALANGESCEAAGLSITAVAAYNLVHTRDNGQPFHPKGEGNGYVVGFGETRVLIAGDTENIPELKALTGIDVAFLPMNLPYTMTPEMVADLARAMRPRILYPYHTGETDVARLVELLNDEKDIEVRVRGMK